MEKGSKWVAQIKRATCPSWGVTPKYAHKLYISVALPKVIYANNIWCTLTHGTETGQRLKGSVAAVRQLTKIQRAGAIAIIGSLCMTLTDALDTCASLFPVMQLIEKWCYRAMVRLTIIPPEHPLYKLVKASANCKIVKHKMLMHNLMQIFKLNPNSVTKIATAVRNPLDANTTPM